MVILSKKKYLSFNVADHPQFKKMISLLRPGYESPYRKELAEYTKRLLIIKKYKMNVLFLVISPLFEYLRIIAQFYCHTSPFIFC